jgi:hypothetical protein
MSSKTNTEITHPLLHIIPCTKDSYHIYLNKGIEFDDNLFDKIEALFKDGFGTKQKPLKMNTPQLNKLITDLDTILNNYNPDKSSDSESEDEEEETIQEVLARRLKSKSSHDIIEDETIEDSQDEDVITLSRRTRYLLNTIKVLKDEIHNLKQSK